MGTDLVGAGEGVGAELPLVGLEATFDSVSRRHLASTGVGRGWACWEVGAGSGSMARWLANRVGPTGSVLATDIDVRGMPSEVRPNLRVVEHDLVGDPLPPRCFRCIHARLVLGVLPQREALLARLTSALVPGGWLVVEDLDLILPPCPESASPAERLVHKVRSGFAELLSEQRGDSGWAASLPSRLASLGLVEVGASAHVAGVGGGSVASSIERAHLAQVRDNLVAFGAATEDEVDRCLQLLGDPGFRFAMPLLVSALGRRPPGGRSGG